MNGTSNTATSKEMPSIRVIAQGKLNRKSCTSPSVMMRNGKKVILIANVAEKIDLKSVSYSQWTRANAIAPRLFSPDNCR